MEYLDVLARCPLFEDIARGDIKAMLGCMGARRLTARQGESVFLEGNRSDVHTLIRDAEIFVLASDYEGLSNALLECMTMGIACISTDCEGSTDVIRDGENGLLVRRGDEKGLTEFVHTLEKYLTTECVTFR